MTTQTKIHWLAEKMAVVTLKPNLVQYRSTFVWNRDPMSSEYCPRRHNGFVVNRWTTEWEPRDSRRARVEFVLSRVPPSSDEPEFEFPEDVIAATPALVRTSSTLPNTSRLRATDDTT